MAVDWHREADMVIIGFGAAGAAASITAADAGAEVVLLEKQPAEWHTPSTRASGGQIMSVTDVGQAFIYLNRCSGGMISIEVTRAWAERALDVVNWVENVAGLRLNRVTGPEHADWEGASAVQANGARESYPDDFDLETAVATGGAVLFAALEEAVRARSGISILYESPANRLLTDQSGRVVGVLAKTPGGLQRFRARAGVVLTCGGYEYDEDMKRSYLRSYPTYFYGSPMNSGDGVRMAQALGADLSHMNSMVGNAIAHFELDGKDYNYSVRITPGGYVFLDKYGRRFVNEHMKAIPRHDFYHELISFDVARSEYPRVPAYWVFDRRRMSHAKPVGKSGAAGPYKYVWSEESRDEIARGWVKTASTLEELFRQARLADPEQAVRTMGEYNEACASGHDPMGRPRDSLIPIDQPPYFLMELWPGGPNTSGGPRRNEYAQVIDVFGDPIPGLYAAGELGEAVGAYYPSNGANISDALCFGRIAAEHAMRQPTYA